MPREPFQRVYTDQEIAAILYNGVDRTPHITPAAIVQAAEAGELVGPDAEKVPAFAAKRATVATYVQREKNRRKKPEHSTDQDPRDRARAAMTEAWSLVDRDIARLKTSSNKTMSVEKRQSALAKVIDNIAKLDTLATKANPAAPSINPAEHAKNAAETEANAKAADPVAGLAERARAASTSPLPSDSGDQGASQEAAREHDEHDDGKPSYGSSPRVDELSPAVA